MSYQYNTLQDCLDECARFETARNNCITAMNSCGLTTPVDASLGMLAHYFGCDSYIGPSMDTKTTATFDDASTAISQIEIKKSKLKTVINNFCAPLNIAITDDLIDDYYTYIATIGSTDLRVQYIANPSSSDYIDLGFTLDNSCTMSAKLRWNNVNPNNTFVESYSLLFGASGYNDAYGETKIHGFTLKRINTPGEDGIRTSYGFITGDYIYRFLGTGVDVTFTNCHTDVVQQSTYYDIAVSGSIGGTSLSATNRDGRLGSVDNNCRIFNDSGYCPTQSRFYYAQIKDANGVVIHNLIPCIGWINGAWVPYIKDTITNTKHYNSGPNTLISGPVVTN